MARILVVDDDRELQENIIEVLEDADFDVCAAANGDAALQKLAQKNIDLVLLDLIMPVMGGMEALAQIKRRFPKVRIVMMTAFSTVDSAVEAMRNGADDFVTKPFKIDDLLMTIRRILEEDRFFACDETLNIDSVLKCLANSIRRNILWLLQNEGQMRFMDIARRLEIEDHTKVNFHLKVLKEAELIEQDEKRGYKLSPTGKSTVDCLHTMSHG